MSNLPADAITAAQDVLTCNCDPGPEGQHQPWCDKLTPLLRLLEAAAPAIAAQGAAAERERMHRILDDWNTSPTCWTEAAMTEFINETDEPQDHEQAVIYWRGRWAASASALTGAVGIIQDVVEHANPVAHDPDGFVAGGYIVTIGAIHRALAWLQGADLLDGGDDD